MIKRSILFLFLNFLALALGGLFTSDGVQSDWYQDLNQAPWTPPGWLFGFMWTLIMICFAYYMAHLITISTDRKNIILLYVLQWVLNVAWNPIFFYYQGIIAAFIVISLLNLLITYFLFYYKKEAQLKSIMIIPYFVWINIAASLNLYILLYN